MNGNMMDFLSYSLRIGHHLANAEEGPHESGEQESNGRNEKIVSPWKFAALAISRTWKFPEVKKGELPHVFSDPAKTLVLTSGIIKLK